MKGDWIKRKEGDEIWWFLPDGTKGEFIFSFDKKKTFNMYQDYPEALTPEEKEIFDRENPFWADYFKEG